MREGHIRVLAMNVGRAYLTVARPSKDYFLEQKVEPNQAGIPSTTHTGDLIGTMRVSRNPAAAINL
jgi:hypothetical protein